MQFPKLWNSETLFDLLYFTNNPELLSTTVNLTFIICCNRYGYSSIRKCFLLEQNIDTCQWFFFSKFKWTINFEMVSTLKLPLQNVLRKLDISTTNILRVSLIVEYVDFEELLENSPTSEGEKTFFSWDSRNRTRFQIRDFPYRQ
jgi:hypothetical protein